MAYCVDFTENFIGTCSDGVMNFNFLKSPLTGKTKGAMNTGQTNIIISPNLFVS